MSKSNNNEGKNISLFTLSTVPLVLVKEFHLCAYVFVYNYNGQRKPSIVVSFCHIPNHWCWLSYPKSMMLVVTSQIFDAGCYTQITYAGCHIPNHWCCCHNSNHWSWLLHPKSLMLVVTSQINVTCFRSNFSASTSQPVVDPTVSHMSSNNIKSCRFWTS